MSDSDTLGSFFGKVRSAGTGMRLFSWKKVCEEADAAEDAYKVLIRDLDETRQKLADSTAASEMKSAEITTLTSQVASAKTLNEQLHGEVDGLTGDLDTLTEEKALLEEKLSAMTDTAKANADSAEQWKAAEGERRGELAKLHEEYNTLSLAHADLTNERDSLAADLAGERSAHLADNDQARLFREQYLVREAEIDAVRKDIDAAKQETAARQAEIDAYVAERDAKFAQLVQEAERLNTLAASLAEEKKAAEAAARASLATLLSGVYERTGAVLEAVCAKFDIPLKTEATYKGSAKPDYAVQVNGSYVFFNVAETCSPEELDQFEKRVAAEAEELFAAAGDAGVRGEAYLVVPTAAAPYLTEFVYTSDRVTVFVVTPEALEGVVRTLRRIEEYEFARQVTPFELDQMCRYLGELSHVTKRKIELDTYFSNEMLEVLQKSENLPTDIAGEVAGYEQAAKVNPPAEREVAVLTVPSLATKVQKIEKAMLARAAAEAEMPEAAETDE